MSPLVTEPAELRTSPASCGTQWLMVDPYLHVGADRIYHPFTDTTLLQGQPGYDELRSLQNGERQVVELPAERVEALRQDNWLVDRRAPLDQRFLLKYVKLEAHTVCNQGCYFCPVAYARREDYFMPTEQYESILDQLTAFRDTIEGVIMINYNEPTVDKRFVDQVRSIRSRGLPPAVLTNGTGFTPKKIDQVVEAGGLRYLSINLSTLDQERYTQERGTGNVKQILRNLDHAKNLPVAEEMDIVVLGTGNEVHKQDFEEIRERFDGSRFEVKYYEVMDRAGHLDVGTKPDEPHTRLCGCENVGSRPLQYIHITPHGKCVLCCEDYDEQYVVGDLNVQTVEEVLASPEMARMRRWVYGVEEAPDDFLCRKCIFALGE